MMNRAAIGAAVLITALLAGCGSREGEGTTVVFWALGAEGENVQKLLPEFERRNPGVHVKLQVIPWTAAHEKLLTAYAGNSTPDLCQWGNTWIPEFRILNALEPLNAWTASSGVVRKENYFEGIWATNMGDTLLYGVPWYTDTRVLFYRTDILAAAGYPHGPKTWEEWLDAARSICRANPGAYAMLLPTTEWAPPVIMGLQAGAQLVKDGGRYGNFDSPAFTRAFGTYIQFFKENLAPSRNTQVTNIYQGFAEGYFAMYVTGPWNIGEFRRRLPAAMQDKWMTTTLPGPDADTPGVSLAGGSSLVLFRASRHKAAAWKLIEYLSEPAQQLAFYHITGDMPAVRSAWKDSSLMANRYARAFMEQLEHVAAPPLIPEWERIAMKVQDYAELASTGTMSVEEALAALDRDVNVILEKRRWMLERE
jgi:multiple sugar transport system substrate-binding protein